MLTYNHNQQEIGLTLRDPSLIHGNESPLLPSPNTPQKPVIPNESANWRMSEVSLRLKRCDKRLVLKEGWPDQFIIMLQIPIPAGVVDCSFKIRIFSFEGFSYYSITASPEMDLFLKDDLKNLRLFLLKMFCFFMPITIKRNP
jgi:hypothetical protein